MLRFIPVLIIVVSILGCEKPAVSIPEAGELPRFEPGYHRESIEVPGVGKVKYSLHIDQSFDPKRATPLILYLHYGYEGSRPKDFTGGEMLGVFVDAAKEIGAIGIAPDAVGGDWTSAANERSAVWLVQSLMNTYTIDTRKIYVVGFSMGGQGAWHLASRHDYLFSGAIPVAAPVTGSAKIKVPAYVIHSKSDNVVSHSAAKSHAEAIETAGGKVHFKSLNNPQHFDTRRYAEHVVEGVRWLREQ